MKFLDDVICPISDVRVDNNLSRLTVFLNAICLGLYVLTGIPYFVVLVALDYGIRVLGDSKYSPLKWVAKRIIDAIKLPEKMADQSPKMFAARLGLLFSASSVVFFPMNTTASLVAAGILLIFTTLDSVFDLCVGCLTYTYIVLPLYKWRGIRS